MFLNTRLTRPDLDQVPVHLKLAHRLGQLAHAHERHHLVALLRHLLQADLK